jgi:hypothetical protein
MGLQLGDVDGDGNLDVAIGLTGGYSYYGFGGTPRVAILLGDGQGSFSSAAEVALTESTQPSGLALGDVDGDGDLDVVAGGLSGGLVYFRNTGRG